MDTTFMPAAQGQRSHSARTNSIQNTSVIFQAGYNIMCGPSSTMSEWKYKNTSCCLAQHGLTICEEQMNYLWIVYHNHYMHSFSDYRCAQIKHGNQRRARLAWNSWSRAFCCQNSCLDLDWAFSSICCLAWFLLDMKKNLENLAWFLLEDILKIEFLIEHISIGVYKI